MNDILLSLDIRLYNDSGLRGISNFGLQGKSNPDVAFSVLNNLLSGTLALVTSIASLWFLFKLFSGAIAIMSSAGDKARLASARNDLAYGAIGLIIVISSLFIAGLIGKILDIDILSGTYLIYNIIDSIWY